MLAASGQFRTDLHPDAAHGPAHGAAEVWVDGVAQVHGYGELHREGPQAGGARTSLVPWGLGVEPSEQGKGIGGVLMQPILMRAGAEGLPCYLETENERNVPFYERHGFEVVSDGEVPKRGLRVWAMVRNPHSADTNFADTP